MSGGTWRWAGYQTCVSAFCTDPVCCSHGHKFRWPELVGKNGKEAKAIIEKDNPEVTVEIITPGRVGYANFCCNRVYLVLDNNGKVTNMPTVG